MKTKIPTSVLIGGAAIAALALSQRARAAAPSAVDLPQLQPGSLTKDQILRFRQDAMDLGISGKFYLFDGVPYWTYLNQAAPAFKFEGTTYYVVGFGAEGKSRIVTVWNGETVERRFYDPRRETKKTREPVLSNEDRFAEDVGISKVVKAYARQLERWAKASKQAWSRGEGLTQPAPSPGDESRKGGRDLSAVGALGGAAAGAAAGTAVLPGIGTAVGAIVGGLAGLLGGRELKEGELEKLTEQAKALGGEVESGFEQAKQDKAAAEDIEAAQAQGEASNE